MKFIKASLAILGIVAAISAAPQSSGEDESNSLTQNTNYLNPLRWLPKIKEHIPNIDNISSKNVASLPASSAATLLSTVFHHSRMEPYSGSLYKPDFSKMKLYLITGEGNVSTPLQNGAYLRKYSQLNTGEVTVFIAGLPFNAQDSNDAVHQLIKAYRGRYQLKSYNSPRTNDPWNSPAVGSLLVIDLGNQLNTFKKWATLDIENTAAEITGALDALTEFVPYYNIHLIGSNVGAQVAGAVARQFYRQKGYRLRHVTGLDPTPTLSQQHYQQSELNRGVADFVDAIHTTPLGGSTTYGDADFYPNGPGAVAPGVDNIIQASLQAVRYYAETVVPGNEMNFLSTACSSLEDYKQRNCHGIRIPMGYDVPLDAKGDFVLQVNSMSPYGRNARLENKL